ncbi:GlxA family transcriptional regulator [Labrys monachus]|uniref:Transcriptional regulator GlxA family with amidase domain n=1 Tax=Labrys monachus TaxID=217067 RepID=A0ABU0FLD6_9HYPH|nr:GlxA family transcriptional regulator [Labrys monachus]MDQ0395413.1 transcriptional regulator GlxA family with amidase domain [Labrys monachus]
MPADDNPFEIALLLYPGVRTAAVYGMIDLFDAANDTALALNGARTASLRVSQWRMAEGGTDVVCVADTHGGRANRPVAVVVLPALGALPTHEVAAPFARWLSERHVDGATLCSVCAGAFLLAETGLLAGRAVTTHWSFAETLSRRFPDIRVEVERMIIDEGDIITAGGIMAWTDLGLCLVDRLLGPAVMLETARFLLVDPPGREQRYYSSFSPPLGHGDEAILKVQRWLQSLAEDDDGMRGVTLAAMAETAGLEERTFLRRFTKATGLKPTEYYQQLRVGKARAMLELTARNVDQVAWAVGYEDPAAFRKVFQRVTGLSPRDYRRRFAAGQAAAALSAAG